MDDKTGSTNLFRSEALSALRSRVEGDVVLFPTISQFLIGSALLTIFISSIVYAFTVEIDQKQVVKGWLTPTTPVVKVYSSNEGLVYEVLVADGDLVGVGEPLVAIRNMNRLTSGEFQGKKVLDSMKTEMLTLKKRKVTLRRLMESEAAALDEELVNLDLQLEATEAGRLAHEKRYDIAFNNLSSSLILLDKGYISKSDIDQLRNDVVQAEVSLRQSDADLSIIKGKIMQVQNDILFAPDRMSLREAEIEERIRDLDIRLINIGFEHELVVRAPVDGVVSNVQVNSGMNSRIFFSRPMLEILPNSTSLQANLLVPTRAVGLLTNGQPIKIKYHSFPYEQYGNQNASVLSISGTAMLPGEQVDIPFSLEEPSYLVRAQIERTSIPAYGKEFSLKPGMTFDADVIVHRRSVAEWFFEPILRMRGAL